MSDKEFTGRFSFDRQKDYEIDPSLPTALIETMRQILLLESELVKTVNNWLKSLKIPPSIEFLNALNTLLEQHLKSGERFFDPECNTDYNLHMLFTLYKSGRWEASEDMRTSLDTTPQQDHNMASGFYPDELNDAGSKAVPGSYPGETLGSISI